MGAVFRVPVGQENAEIIERSVEALSGLAKTRSPVSSLSEPITKLTPWDVHYYVKKVDGGSDAASKLYMHHLGCHKPLVRRKYGV
jgi:hypothetical protein